MNTNESSSVIISTRSKRWLGVNMVRKDSHFRCSHQEFLSPRYDFRASVIPLDRVDIHVLVAKGCCHDAALVRERISAMLQERYGSQF
jgi:hypothetical protein